MNRIPSGIFSLTLALAPAAFADGASNLPAKLDLKGAITYALDHNYAVLQAREQIRQQEKGEQYDELRPAKT